jgi:hypothetical protein
MSVDLVHDLWQELKRYISVTDRGDAADTMVNLLIDNDYDAEQIRDSFKSDNDIKRALQSYLDEDFDDADEQDFDNYDEEDH